jgi:hypothetical protein
MLMILVVDDDDDDDDDADDDVVVDDDADEVVVAVALILLFRGSLGTIRACQRAIIQHHRTQLQLAFQVQAATLARSD